MKFRLPAYRRYGVLDPAAWIGSLLILGMAVFMGLLAVTANTMLISVGAGLVVGLFLLAVPHVSVWLILVLGMLTGAFVSLAGPFASKMPWAVSLLSMSLLIPSLVALIWHRKAPGYIWMAVLFMAYCVIVSVMRWESLVEFSGGFKRYFQGYGLMLALAVLAFSEAQIQRWFRFMVFVAAVQLPFCLFQLFVLVPMRGGLARGGEVTDVVAGSFSANLVGGSSGTDLVVFVMIALAMVIARWKAGLLSRGKALFAVLLFLAPLALGESKVVVVLMPLAFLVLYAAEIRRQPMKYLPAMVLVAVGTVLLAWLYANVYVGKTLQAMLLDTASYNFGEVGYGTSLLNRTTVLSFWWSQQNWADPLSVLIGNGLGASFSGQGVLGGHIAASFPGYGINRTATSTMLWDIGVLGLAFYICLLWAAWRAAGRLVRDGRDAAIRADALALRVAIMLAAATLNYTDSQVNLITNELIFACVFGYLAILIRRNEQADLPALSHR